MHAGHILLGRPWQFDRRVTHDGYKNRYSLVVNNRTILLTPLRPAEAYADQIRIARECKLRDEQLSVQEKERKEKKNESKQKRRRNIKVNNHNISSITTSHHNINLLHYNVNTQA